MTDRAAVRGRLEDAVAAAVAGGADWVQVRDRALETRELAALVERVSTAARAAARAARRTVRVLVNRRVDVALAVGADGVHLGFDALSVEQARALLGPAPLIGVSAHDPAEVAEAARRGADYAHLAPIHAPLSKPATRPPLGAAALARARRAGIPVLAQGGVAPANAAALRAAGAAGVAVTGAVLGAPDPAEAARALRMALHHADEERAECSI